MVQFFEQMGIWGDGLSFDDVILRAGYSELSPEQIDIASHFSKNIPLQTPIVSAAMDTVTESAMAICLALAGGLGVIHRFLEPEVQAKEVARVKLHLNGLIEKPIMVKPEDTLQAILNRCAEKGWSFRSFPVTDDAAKLVGIITETDFLHCHYPESSQVQDIMSKEVFTCQQGTTIEQALAMMDSPRKINAMPMVNEDGVVVGLYIYSDLKRIVSGSMGKSNLDANNQLRVGAAIGTGEEALSRAELLNEKKVDVLVIDASHGDCQEVVKTVKFLKGKYPDLDVVAGNVSESESTQRLIEAGADGIKIGQGPGSTCTTRVVTGAGRPQISAIYVCAMIAHQYDIPICADGGIRYSGDITKAIAAGASSVMIGNLMAGTEEAPGEIIYADGRVWKSYRGMGSQAAMEKYKSSRERYRQGEPQNSLLIPQGIEGRVPFRGSALPVIEMLRGGLRHGMGLAGAKNVAELHSGSSFVFVSGAAKQEAHPHDLQIVKESPNYSPPTIPEN